MYVHVRAHVLLCETWQSQGEKQQHASGFHSPLPVGGARVAQSGFVHLHVSVGVHMCSHPHQETVCVTLHGGSLYSVSGLGWAGHLPISVQRHDK